MYALRPKPVDFEGVWDNLKKSINRVITLQSLERKVWDDNFHDIYSMCVAVPEPLSERLYLRTKQSLEEHVSQLYKEVRSHTDGQLLEAYYERWRVYFKGSAFIHNLYGYLNKQYIKTHKYSDADLNYGTLEVNPMRSSMVEVGELALDIWRREMIMPLEDALVRQLLAAIESDRQGNTTVKSSVVKEVILSFVNVREYQARDELELYRALFEEEFLLSTSKHYKSEASRMWAECSVSQYMERVLACIEEENLRARKFVHSSSYDKVTKKCQEVMIEAHKDRLHARSRELVEKEQTHDLTNMYTLLKPISQGLTVLVSAFECHVRKLGLDGVQDLKGDNVPQQFVESMLEVYNHFSQMVSSLFQNDQEFWSALDKALQTAVNYKEESRSCPKASEWLAKYTDFLLRKSAKGMNETEVDEKLSMAIVIFRYIEDKDIFQKFYSKMLAQRLIHGASVSMDAEESMIHKLKQACGYEFTSKLQRMFTDVGLSKDLTEKFYADLEETGGSLQVQMQIQVLQAGAWPLSTQPGPNATSLAIPLELQPSITLFEQFYSRNYNGRKLTWLYNLAAAEVKLNYLDKSYQITMSVQQLAVLLCFADNDQTTVREVESGTQLTGDVLNRVLRSVIDSGLLLCNGKEIQEDSVLQLNLNFTQKRLRFKIMTPAVQRQAEKETEQVTTTVQNDRKYFMECTIVRIMKTRKVLKHNALIEEVFKQSAARFSPDVNFIKKIIESLIEKQYLQRTEQNDEYAYLA